MKYAIVMGSGAVLYVPSFMKTGSGIQKLNFFFKIEDVSKKIKIFKIFANLEHSRAISRSSLKFVSKFSDCLLPLPGNNPHSIYSCSDFFQSFPSSVVHFSVLLPTKPSPSSVYAKSIFFTISLCPD
jgi:hypothetical protein